MISNCAVIFTFATTTADYTAPLCYLLTKFSIICFSINVMNICFSQFVTSIKLFWTNTLSHCKLKALLKELSINIRNNLLYQNHFWGAILRWFWFKTSINQVFDLYYGGVFSFQMLMCVCVCARRNILKIIISICQFDVCNCHLSKTGDWMKESQSEKWMCFSKCCALSSVFFSFRAIWIAFTA